MEELKNEFVRGFEYLRNEFIEANAASIYALQVGNVPQRPRAVSCTFRNLSPIAIGESSIATLSPIAIDAIRTISYRSMLSKLSELSSISR